MWKLCGLVLVVIVSAAAAAPPNFGNVAGKSGCAAIPGEYADLVKSCEAKTKAVETACKKAKPCDAMQADVRAPIDAVAKDHDKTKKLEANRKDLLGKESTEEAKKDNMPAVKNVMKQIDDVDQQERAVESDVEAQEEKEGAVLDDRITAWRDCFSARTDLVDVYVEVEDRAAQEVANEDDDLKAKMLVGQIDPVFPAWETAIADALVKPELIAQAQTCQEERSHRAEFMDGNTIAYQGCIGAGAFKDSRLGWTSVGKAQAWCAYQNATGVANPKDDTTTAEYSKWSMQYDKLKASWSRGSAFELAALAYIGKKPSNPAKPIMYAGITNNGPQPPCTKKLKATNFIPDATNTSALVLNWGDEYNFVEIKDRKQMAKSENLGLMIDYVDKCGGHLTVVFRGQVEGPTQPNSPDNETELTGPLKDALKNLVKDGKADVRYFRSDTPWP